MKELAHTAANRMKLLREVNARLMAMIDFTMSRLGGWNDSDLKEYRKLHAAWSDAVNELSYFENPGTRPLQTDPLPKK